MGCDATCGAPGSAAARWWISSRKRDADGLFFRADGVQVPKVNDRLQPGELKLEFGQDVAIRSIATAGIAAAPAWRV